jgi:hypothetical protein
MLVDVVGDIAGEARDVVWYGRQLGTACMSVQVARPCDHMAQTARTYNVKEGLIIGRHGVLMI